MVYYLSFKSVKDSIEAAESVEDTINYWKTILSLYFSATKGFSLIHPQSREDVIVLRFPRLPQSPDLLQHDLQCVIMVSAQNKERPACKDEESDAYTYLMDLDRESHGRESFGISASGSSFSLFKVVGKRLYSLIPTSNLAETIVGKILERKFKEMCEASDENRCKVITQSADDIYITPNLSDSDGAFSTTELFDTLLVTSSTRFTNNFRRAGYEDLISRADGSLERSHACWKAILSCIIPENSGISTGFIENAGILTLNYTLTPSRVQPPVTVSTSRCLLMVKLYQQPQWDVLASNIYTLLKMTVAAGSNDGKIHGMLACGTQFLLFQVRGNDNIHYLMGNKQLPSNLRDLLNDGALRERFEGYMNGIMTQGIIALAQGRGDISTRVHDTGNSNEDIHPCAEDSLELPHENELCKEEHTSS